jgi:hypothetical protein
MEVIMIDLSFTTEVKKSILYEEMINNNYHQIEMNNIIYLLLKNFTKIIFRYLCLKNFRFFCYGFEKKGS